MSSSAWQPDLSFPRSFLLSVGTGYWKPESFTLFEQIERFGAGRRLLWTCDGHHSQRWRKETTLRVPSLSCYPHATVNVALTVAGLILRGEEEEARMSEWGKQGWSLWLKWKHQQGKQSGFPPVVINPRHACHLSLPVTARHVCVWSPSAALQVTALHSVSYWRT